MKPLSGTVISTAMDKSIVVYVNRLKKVPVIGKVITRHSKFMVHDENEIANVGDKVSFLECRPLSKSKKWKLLDIIHPATTPAVAYNIRKWKQQRYPLTKVSIKF